MHDIVLWWCITTSSTFVAFSADDDKKMKAVSQLMIPAVALIRATGRLYRVGIRRMWAANRHGCVKW